MKGMRGSQDNKLRAKLLAAGKDLLDPKLVAPRILSECEDFVKEKESLQEIVESLGHILILSPKCHPELAGCGIEYSWGKSKQYFRRTANDMIASNLLHFSMFQISNFRVFSFLSVKFLTVFIPI